jgi:hypothetical protein
MSIRNTFSKVASVFVEIPPQQNKGTHDNSKPDNLLSALGLSRVVASPAPLVQVPDVPLDLPNIYRQFNVPVVAFVAEQALDLIDSIPHERAPNARRQMARGMLSALSRSTGVGPRDVAADASAKIAALDGYARDVSRQTENQIQRLEMEIAALQTQIEQKREAIGAERARTALTSKKCEEEADRLRLVVEYFGGSS